MIKAKRIGHATFTTPDIERQIEYYRNVVGLHVVDREPKRAFLGTNSGQLAVVLKLGAHETCERISFEVSPLAGFAEMSKHLAALGLKAETRTDSIPGISQILTFQDLKGTAIELFPNLASSTRALKSAARWRSSSVTWHLWSKTREPPLSSTKMFSASAPPIGSETISYSSDAAPTTIR